MSDMITLLFHTSGRPHAAGGAEERSCSLCGANRIFLSGGLTTVSKITQWPRSFQMVSLNLRLRAGACLPERLQRSKTRVARHRRRKSLSSGSSVYLIKDKFRERLQKETSRLNPITACIVNSSRVSNREIPRKTYLLKLASTTQETPRATWTREFVLPVLRIVRVRVYRPFLLFSRLVARLIPSASATQ